MTALRTDYYQAWCRKHHKDMVIIPAGIQRIGKFRFGDDGFIYRGRKRVSKYLVSESLDGLAFVLKHQSRKDVHRFERVRWRVLEHIEELIKRWRAIFDEVVQLHPDKREVQLIGLHNDKWYRASFNVGADREQSVSVSAINVDKLEVLDRIVALTRTEAEQNLVSRFLEVRARLARWHERESRITAGMGGLLRSQLTSSAVTNDFRPDVFIVNGRAYPVLSRGYRERRDFLLFWPTPGAKVKNLDHDSSVDGQ